MEPIDFDKGLLAYKLVRNDIAITSEHLSNNRACENLLRNPVTLKLVGRYSFPDPLPANLDGFRLWLQEEFDHLDSGEYVLICWRSGGFWWKKKHVFAKRWIPFARFEVQDGTVVMNKEHKRNSRGRTYRVWLLYDLTAPESIDFLWRPKKITYKSMFGRR